MNIYYKKVDKRPSFVKFGLPTVIKNNKPPFWFRSDKLNNLDCTVICREGN